MNPGSCRRLSARRGTQSPVAVHNGFFRAGDGRKPFARRLGEVPAAHAKPHLRAGRGPAASTARLRGFPLPGVCPQSQNPQRVLDFLGSGLQEREILVPLLTIAMALTSLARSRGIQDGKPVLLMMDVSGRSGLTTGVCRLCFQWIPGHRSKSIVLRVDMCSGSSAMLVDMSQLRAYFHQLPECPLPAKVRLPVESINVAILFSVTHKGSRALYE